MQLKRRERGIAMIYALLLMVVAMGVATLMFARTLGEIKQSGSDAGIVQSLMLARGAANLGGIVLQEPVKADLQTIVQAQSGTTGPWSFGTSVLNAPAPTPLSVKNALSVGSSSVAGQLQPEIDKLLCGKTVQAKAGGYGDVRIYVSDTDAQTGAPPCGKPLPGGITLPAAHFVSGSPRNASGSAGQQVYALPFVLVADGYVGSYHRNVVIQGEYDFTVGRPSFAKYALFTNVHELPPSSGSGDVWFTDNTLFDGPVHTNQYFRFYHKPWFGGYVTSAGCANPGPTSCNGTPTKTGAEFYYSGFVKNPGPHPAFGPDAPQLTAGVDWSSKYVELPQASTDQASAAQTSGLYFGKGLSSLTLWAADSSGEPLTKNAAGKWTPAASYQYIKACTSSGCTLYRYGSDGELYAQNAGGHWVDQKRSFNGVIYSTGNIHRLSGPARTPAGSTSPADAPPALASFAQVTVASQGSTTITGDLTYEDQPCQTELKRLASGAVQPAQCSNLNAHNVLGVYAQGGNVVIANDNYNGPNAPENVKIDAVLMSATGTVSVQNYAYGSPRGTVHLLGGVIEYDYGAFGTFDPYTGQDVSGYSRQFTYDKRMLSGLAPPHFPTVGGDEVQSVALYTYGQREQVY